MPEQSLLFDDELPAPTRAAHRTALEVAARRELARRGCDQCGSQAADDLVWVRRLPWPSWLLPVPRALRLEAPPAEVVLAMTSSVVRCRRCHLEDWSRKMWGRRCKTSVGIVDESQTATGGGRKALKVFHTKGRVIVRETIDVA